MSIRVAMIGAGMISDVHLKALKAHPEVDLACLVDLDANARAAQAAAYGIAQTAADYREVLDDPTIDAVDIAAPHFLHCPITLAALAQGKHVICEKPIGLNLEEADKMIGAAESASGRLLIKKYQRSAPHHQKAREIIQAGGIGRIFLATGLLVTQQLHLENEASNWRGDWEKAGGGVMIDSSVHLIDLMQFMMGPAVAVTATAKRLVANFPEKADDTACITVEYASGAVANILSTNVDVSLPGMNWEKVFYGTEGSLHIFQQGNLTKLVKYTEGKSEEIISVENWWEGANVAVVTHLVDCLLDGSEPNASLAEARHDLEIVLAGYRAAREGRRITIEP